jgi:hypothetical protein
MLSITSNAQDVVVDWAAKKLSSQPTSVEKNTQANVRVNNVNDLMFTYSISYQLKPLAISDFDTIAKAFSIAGAAAKSGGEAVNACDISEVLSSQKALTDAETAFLNLPATQSAKCSKAKPCDISLQEAKNSWDTTVAPKITTAQTTLTGFANVCKSDTSNRPSAQQQWQSIRLFLRTIRFNRES